MPLRTEADAKTTLCVHTAGASSPARCVAADCMGWRWVGWRKGDGSIDPSPKKSKSDPDARLVFCGLAGRPDDAA